MTGSAVAGEWTGRAAVSPSISYTDNVCLTKNNKKGDWVGTLTPAGSIQGKGRNASLTLDGSVQLNSLTNSALNSKGCNGNYDDREQYSPEVRGVFNAILIPQWLDLNVQARADQNEVTTRAPGGGDDLNRTGNTNTYYRYSISPTVKRRFKDWVNLNLKYTWDEQFNSSERVSDSNRHKVNAVLSNASQSRWSRSVEGRFTRVEYGESFNGITRQDTELSSARVTLGYSFSRRWAADAYYGREWNEFQTTLKGDKDGPAWGYNVHWTPTSRTAVSVGGGDRFFGNTPRVNIRHAHKRHNFSLSYSKEVTFQRDIRNEELDGFEDNIDNPSVLSNGPLLDERLAAGWNYDGRYYTLSINGNYSEQTRSEDGEQSVFKDINVSLNPQLSTTYSTYYSLAWREDEPRGRINELPGLDDTGVSETWTFSAGISRSFNNRFSMSLAYYFNFREGTSDFNEYQENRITATLGIAL